MAGSSDEPGGSAQQHEREAQALHEQAEHEGELMQKRSEELEQEIGQARDDWQSKRTDPSVPGAPPQDRDASEP